MAITDEQRAYYIDKVCSLCKNRDKCNKDKFILTEIYDRVSIKCLSYEYENNNI